MAAAETGLYPMSDNFYRAYEEKYRGTREAIISRLHAYLPFVEPLARIEMTAPTIDLGCGRGEWLELMAEIGFSPFGVDLDEGMLQACKDKGLPAEKGDAVVFLGNLPSESQVLITAFHVVEHLSFEQLRSVVSEAHRVLKPGGLLIMETPNPENIVVATQNFYLDPTHQRPIPWQLLSFLPEYYGFMRVKTIRLQEDKHLLQKFPISLQNVISGVSPDYAVIAQKAATDEIIHLLDQAFRGEYGLSLDTIAEQYHKQTISNAQESEKISKKAMIFAQQAETKAERAETKAQQAETKAQQAETKAQQAETKAQQAETKAQQAEASLRDIYNSRSWRITMPLRRAGNVARWIASGSIAWFTFAPGSRPRRVSRNILITIKSRISSRPMLKAFALQCLAPFPHLYARLRVIGIQAQPLDFTCGSSNCKKHIESIKQLPPRTRQIYNDLEVAIEQRRKGHN